MSAQWTLPLIQLELDGLSANAEFALGDDDATRLFGINNAAVGRIQNFASGHNCRALFRSGTLIFRKLPPRI